MRRLARLGTGADACDCLAEPSRRFLSVTDNNDPLKIWACNLFTAICAAEGDEKMTCADDIFSVEQSKI